jgi:hypothetical protein
MNEAIIALVFFVATLIIIGWISGGMQAWRKQVDQDERRLQHGLAAGFPHWRDLPYDDQLAILEGIDPDWTDHGWLDAEMGLEFYDQYPDKDGVTDTQRESVSYQLENFTPPGAAQ